jgi:hypothetical protein
VKSVLLFTNLFALAFSCARTEPIINLDKVGKALGYPPEQLVIIDYLDQEKFIYTKKTSTEDQRGLMPPVDPASIYQSYSIVSKTPNALLPIVVTISKRNAYVTPYVDNFMAEANRLPEIPVSDKGRLPFGKFNLSGTSSAIFYMEEMRIPAQLKKIIEPGDTWTRQDEYPKFHMSSLSIVQDASSEVDVRIALYASLYYPNHLIQIPGGEEYFAAFNEEVSDNPKDLSILDIFKGLNQIVLTSPIMNPYRKMPVPSISAPELPQKEITKPTENLESIARKQPTTVTKPQPKELSWLWLVGLIVLLSVMGFAAKRYFSKSAT